MLPRQPNIALFARCAVKLLQGPLFEDATEHWTALLRYQLEVSDYFERIGLELIVDSRDGYAYLRQIELDDDGATVGLIKRRPLTYDFSLVCVFLREWLDEFEAGDLDSRGLYITPRQFRERLEVFFKEKPNEVKFIRELNSHVKTAVDFGYLHLTQRHPDNTDEDRYEVRRILKARVTPDQLAEFKAQLAEE